MKGAKLFGLFLLVVGIAAGIFFFSQWRSRESAYQAAHENFKQGNLQEAITAFSDLGKVDFKDSSEMANKVSFQLASNYVQSNDYYLAIPILIGLERKDWPGSKSLLREAQYREKLKFGNKLLNLEDFHQAKLVYEHARDIKDSKEIHERLENLQKTAHAASLDKYHEGNRFYRQRNYEKAIEAFNSALELNPSLNVAGRALDKAEKSLVKADKAKELILAQEGWRQARQKRRVYATYLENEFLSSGRDARVSVSGKNSATLKITWIGIGRPEAYQMANDPTLRQAWRRLGFLRVTVGDGYLNSWSFSLY